MASIKICYALTPERTKTLKIKQNDTVGDVLQKIQEKEKNDKLQYLFLDNALINNADTLSDYHDPSFVYIISETGDYPEQFNEKIKEEEEVEPKPEVIDINDTLPTDIPDPVVIKPTNLKKKFRVFSNLTMQTMTQGFFVEGISEAMNARAVKNIVLEHIKSNSKFDDVIENKAEIDVFIFLPCGIYFQSGTYEDWANACDCTRYILYAVVTRKLGDSANKLFKEICDCSSDEMRLLLSPLFDSTEEGYTQIASLLGYFYYGGTLETSERILRCLATMTGFAPMVNSLYTIMVQKKVNGIMIASITSALQTLITQRVRGSNPTTAFSYAISFMSYINNIKIVNLPIPNLFAYQYKDEDDKDLDSVQRYLKDHEYLNFTVLWDKDIQVNNSFKVSKLHDPLQVEQLNEKLALETSLKPVSPMTIPYLHCVSFVRLEKDNPDSTTKVGLFVRKLPNNERNVEFINPEENGKIQIIDYNDLARKIGDKSIDRNIKSRGDTSLQQIIYICLDTSISMKNTLIGSPRKRASKEQSRISLSISLLKLLMKRIYDFKIPTARGLIIFGGDDVKDKCPLSVAEKDFDEAVEDIIPSGVSPIWKAIDMAADKIIEFNPSRMKDGEKTFKYPSATNRIILISDADATDSKDNVAHSISQKMVENNIILDVIMVSTEEGYLDALISSNITGGYSFQPTNESEGIQLFENECFIDAHARPASAKVEGEINDEVFLGIGKKLKVNPFTDIKKIKNRYINVGLAKRPLSTINYTLVYRKDERHQPTTICGRHIIKQLQYIKKMADENIIVYVCRDDIKMWHVFIKGIDGTPYEKGWWDLLVTFPSNYPNSPPSFRYLSIPYHQNVSTGGKVLCLSISDGYNPKMKMTKILTDIRNLFETPDNNYCLRQSILDEKTKKNDEFITKAKANTTAHSKDDYRDFIDGIKVYDLEAGEIAEDDEAGNPDDLFVTVSPSLKIPPKIIGGDEEIYDD